MATKKADAAPDEVVETLSPAEQAAGATARADAQVLQGLRERSDARDARYVAPQP